MNIFGCSAKILETEGAATFPVITPRVFARSAHSFIVGKVQSNCLIAESDFDLSNNIKLRELKSPLVSKIEVYESTSRIFLQVSRNVILIATLLSHNPNRYLFWPFL